ncbi:MAG: RHS repeat protein, partial [Tyzzerella sp.]|nr:RHS repeat protein [Tyzzerella sp.]
MDSADEKGCGRKYTPTCFSYDPNGNLTCIRTASGYEIRREYDLCDRMISETHCDKNGSIDNTVSYTYDREGRLTGIRH